MTRAGVYFAAAAMVSVLGACTTRVDEAMLLHPVKAGSLSESALAKAAPAYSLSRHSIPAPDGTKLHAVLLRQPGAKATVLYFGGNGYTIGRFGAWTARLFAPLGVDLMIVDHRGYGLSEGRPSAATFESDGVAAFDYLGGQGARNIVLHGQSLGSFAAGHVAANRSAAGVVLESSVTTTEDWAKVLTPSLARPFVRVEIAESLRGRGNLGNVRRIEEPLLLLVGAKDETTPPHLSRSLYAASPLPPERKRLVVIPRAGHDNVLGQAEAAAAYSGFLDTILSADRRR